MKPLFTAYPRYYSHGDSKLVHFGLPSYDDFHRGASEVKNMKEENKKNWEKKESTIFKFEKVGDSIEGLLVGREEGKNFGNQVYKIKKGEVVYTVFSTTVMTSSMADVMIGEEVKIVYMGEKENEKKGQNPIKIFEVFTR